MKLFTESRECQMRAHCVACRSREKGRPWRQAIGKAFALPSDDVDFDCPHGVAWEAGRPPLPIQHIPDDYDPETSPDSPKNCGCCDPPKPIQP